ncbi:MAG: amidohydrolase [Bacteroidetes bacterium]|nr:amidohydrolase [Bacteroidota bacterium]
MIIEQIKSESDALFERLVSIRRHIHSNPELSFEEYNTAKFVESFLNEWGIPNQRMATTGVIGLIEGGQPGKTIALRADLDALPIIEKNNVSYKSQNEGVMHACGHDVHTTCLLGAAYILNQNRDKIKGRIKLVFQPGEEKLPGGASLLIKEGVLENPKVDMIVGQHVMPLIDVGGVGFREGLYMASTDEIYLTIKGKGGHGAMPHMGIDPITIAATLIVELQQVVSRFCPPHIPCVLSFGKIQANGATNVIPDEVYLEGTFRTLDEEWRAKAHELISNFIKSTVEARGAGCDLDIKHGYPFLKNNPELTRKCRNSALKYMGENKVEELGIWMAAEDFAWYSHQVPACFYRLGIRNTEKGIVNNVHNPQFDIDEQAIKTGAGLMAFIAMDVLEASM